MFINLSQKVWYQDFKVYAEHSSNPDQNSDPTILETHPIFLCAENDKFLLWVQVNNFPFVEELFLNSKDFMNLSKLKDKSSAVDEVIKNGDFHEKYSSIYKSDKLKNLAKDNYTLTKEALDDLRKKKNGNLLNLFYKLLLLISYCPQNIEVDENHGVTADLRSFLKSQNIEDYETS